MKIKLKKDYFNENRLIYNVLRIVNDKYFIGKYRWVGKSLIEEVIYEINK